MSGKFDDVPTESMFDAEEYREGKTRQKTPKSVAQGKCPLCTRPKLGAIRLGEHLAWRTHTYTTWGGRAIDCVASGVYLCVLPETKPLDLSAPLHCRHT
jgi:D-arabinose 1-dehydrogenase-like Zn-dependent alcohol dehydrogenase